MKIQYMSLASARIRSLKSTRARLYVVVGFAILALTAVLAGCSTSGGATNEEAEPSAEPEIEMGIELPGAETVEVPFVVSGWAVDLAAVSDTGIDVVQILDEGCEGVVIGIAEYGLERDDIESRYAEHFLYSGWEFEVSNLRTGDHTLAARSRGTGSEDYDACQAIQLTVE